MRCRRAILLAVPWLAACGPREGVTVYTSVDEAYSRPVLEAFTDRTGIPVRAVYDVEAQKTTGLYYRLLAEKERPRADVFWNSEVARTLELARAGLLAPYRPAPAGDLPPGLLGRGGLWTGGALRARVVLYHRARLGERPPPRSIADLAAPRFRGDAALARPLFGTSATHAGALRAVLGKEGMERFYREVVASGARVVEGNALVRRLVAAGEVTLGLTDTDDAHESLLGGDPVTIVYPDQEGSVFPGREKPLGTFLIPTTVAVIAGAPRPELARKLADYLASPATEEALARGSGAFIPARRDLKARPSLRVPERLISMEVEYDAVAEGIEASRDFLRDLFLR